MKAQILKSMLMLSVLASFCFPATTYKLYILNDGNGTTSPTSSITVNAGVYTTIKAIPKTGYSFVGWSFVSGAGTLYTSSTAATNAIKIANHTAIKANFKLIPVTTYKLTIQNDGHGTTTPSGTITVKYGVATTIKAIPSKGYVFRGWSLVSGKGTISGKSTDATTNIMLTANTIIKANFYAYSVKAKELQVSESENALPQELVVEQNAPNPFNPSTSIAFAIPLQNRDGIEMDASNVTVTVFDMSGKIVKSLINEPLSAGYYKVSWDGKSNNGMTVSAGHYICRISALGYVKNIKMEFMK
ncbi:MAG: InlB B-repeat-containing protein [Fibrobacteres bacterium]|nr:InlB B-repeat-containing protein [Fibrobacterota bacterium]